MTIELTAEEREALICDCGNSLTEECPAHGGGDHLWVDVPAHELVQRAEHIVAAKVAAAEQRAERVTAAVEALAGEMSAAAYLTLRSALADPAPREYDDGGPRVREAVDRAERDAEVAACELGSVETQGYYIGERWCNTHGGHTVAAPCRRVLEGGDPNVG